MGTSHPSLQPAARNAATAVDWYRGQNYDGAIMPSRTQVTLDPELQRLARNRASQLGISFAEYIRRLVTRDLQKPHPIADPSTVFDLGSSGVSDVARDKDQMVADAMRAEQRSESDK